MPRTEYTVYVYPPFPLTRWLLEANILPATTLFSLCLPHSTLYFLHTYILTFILHMFIRIWGGDSITGTCCDTAILKGTVSPKLKAQTSRREMESHFLFTHRNDNSIILIYCECMHYPLMNFYPLLPIGRHISRICT
jgi:hypothetical protein